MNKESFINLEKQALIASYLEHESNRLLRKWDGEVYNKGISDEKRRKLRKKRKKKRK